MTVHTEILLIAIAVSIACAIPGVFLVLRRMSMMADAITHTVFLDRYHLPPPLLYCHHPR